MVRIRRLVSAGFALIYSVAVGVHSITGVLFGAETVGAASRLLWGVCVSFLVAYLMLWTKPEINIGRLWRFSGISFVLFLVGNLFVTGGLYAPADAQLSLSVVVLWGVSMVLAYGISAGWTRRRAAIN